jgi:hypothetical protein
VAFDRRVSALRGRLDGRRPGAAGSFVGVPISMLVPTLFCTKASGNRRAMAWMALHDVGDVDDERLVVEGVGVGLPSAVVGPSGFRRGLEVGAAELHLPSGER